MDILNFSVVLDGLKAGKSFARAGWNGKGMFISLQTQTETSKMTLPYIFMKTADEKFVPWVASQTDILAEDWAEVSVEV